MMLQLVRVEVNRLRWRRAVMLLVPVALLLPLALLAVWTLNTTTITQADRVEAAAQVQRDIDSRWMQRELRWCERSYAEERLGLGQTEIAQRCRDELYPEAEAYLPFDVMDPWQAIDPYGYMVAVIVCCVLMLGAMTYAGADWSSGSMSNQLLFNPRRHQLFAAKLVAVGLWAVTVTVVVLGLWWLSLGAVGLVRDLSWPAGWVGEAAQLTGRAGLLAGLCATGAFAVTMLLRHTVAALGVILAFVGLTSLFVYALGLHGWVPLTVPMNAGGILLEETRYATYEWSAERQRRVWTEHSIGPFQGFAYFAVLWLLATVPAAWAFGRRDVP